MTTDREYWYGKQQQILAEEGIARGQCDECGTYRLDGKAPVLHHDGCSHIDDWRADPLYALDLPGAPA